MATKKTPTNDAPRQAAGSKANQGNGIKFPRHLRTTEGYRALANEALRALVLGKIGRDQAYAIRDLSAHGAELLMSYGVQKRTPAGVIVVADEDLVEVSHDDMPPQIDGEATLVEEEDLASVEDVRPTPQPVGCDAKVIALVRPKRAANDEPGGGGED